MKTVTRSRVDVIQHARPNAFIDFRNGDEVLVIPEYDIHTDQTSEIVMKVIEDPKTGPNPYRSGDVHYTKDGQPFKIVPGPTGSKTPRMRVRKGPVVKE